jgi:cytochrome bd-type quinol oxidase subunit 1
MELLGPFVWITVGFVPMLCAMELAWRLENKVRLNGVTMREVSPDAVLRK